MGDRMPSFFILGAPKCGTTSLARWLAEHPEIFLSPVKEPHYFSIDLANRSVKNPRQYARLFDGVKDAHRAVGEASTWYLFSREAVRTIEGVHPGARYIAMTRDPLDMAHSLHHHNLRVLHEDQESFEDAWRLQAERAVGRCIPASCTEPAFLQYFDACSLGSQLRRLYQQVPSERVLHVPLTQVKTDPAVAYRRVLAFLGVPDDGREDFPAANEARGHRSRTAQQLIRWGGSLRMALGVQRGFGLARLNERPRAKAELSDSFRKEVEAAFTDERRLLAELREKQT